MTNIVVLQGTDSGIRWLINDSDGAPYDFTGWTVRSQVRATAWATGTLHEWSVDLGNASLSDDGYVSLFWSHDETADWDWSGGVYDIELTSPDGKVSRLDSGRVTVRPEVTR
jgi:hypothetical protein